MCDRVALPSFPSLTYGVHAFRGQGQSFLFDVGKLKGSSMGIQQLTKLEQDAHALYVSQHPAPYT